MHITFECLPFGGNLNTENNKKTTVEYDFAICRRGNVGTLRTERLETQTYKIKVMDSTKIEEVKNTILNFDWHNFKKHQSAPSLSKNDIYRLFKSEGRKKINTVC